jgi:hypothetical protein
MNAWETIEVRLRCCRNGGVRLLNAGRIAEARNSSFALVPQNDQIRR